MKDVNKITVTVGHGPRVITKIEASLVWIEKEGVCRTLKAIGLDGVSLIAVIPLRLLDTVKIQF